MQSDVAVNRDRRAGDRREPAPAAWDAAIRRVLADRRQPSLVFQPIVDLAHGTIAGYEALARFAGPPSASPDRWFAAAEERGRAAELEARVVGEALARVGELPDDSFLSLNLSPHLLASPEVQAVLGARPRLDRLLLELTEHREIPDLPGFLAMVERCRERGAHVAMDDTGAGYSGLARLLEIRPSFVKLDRALIVDVDRDPAKRALIEMIGPFTGRLDAWLIAEGVERFGELEELIRLGVPLAQGYLLGRPQAGWAQDLPVPLREMIERMVDTARAADGVESCMERAPAVRAAEDLPLLFLSDPGLETAVVLDGHQRPVALHTRALAIDGRQPNRRLLIVRPETSLAETAQRAMTRARAERFDPVVCCDGQGTYLGVVTVDRLLLAVARDS